MMLRRNRLGSWLGLFLASILVLTGCAKSVDDRGDDGYIGGAKKITTVEPQDRVALGELAGVDLEGNEISTAEFSGNVLVINLWGSWCPPCRKEAPVLRQVSEENADRGVQFIGLLTKDKPAAALAFNEKAGITYPTIVDNDGRLQLAFTESLPSQAIPTTWVVDRNGKIAARIVDGDLSVNTLSDVIDWTKKSTP